MIIKIFHPKFVARNNLQDQINGFLQDDIDDEADDLIREAKKTEIRVIRIAEFITKTVGTRQIPNDKKGAVVMKLDVEVRSYRHCYMQNLSFCLKRQFFCLYKVVLSLKWHSLALTKCIIGKRDEDCF